ncbi:MAG: hypothetical protein J5I59_08165 [Saprospiraceae bacterium]|nr:hypothetical protein [Saprospiraceae bacterium]
METFNNPSYSEQNLTQADMTSFSSTDPSEFSEIDSLININQLKTAESLLSPLITKFRENGQWDGFIRGTLTMAKIKSMGKDGEKVAIQYLENAITSTNPPAKQILYSLTALAYASYLDANHYRMSSALPTTDEEAGPDFMTWPVSTFIHKIDDYFSKSIADENLKNIPVSKIDLLTTPSKLDNLRPSLYDFLAYQQLQYLGNTRNFLAEPVYKFEIKGKQWFAPLAQFVNMDISAPDSTSRILTSLQTYQKLMRFHLENNQPDALHFIDLERLNFVYQHSVDPDKLTFFKDALEAIVQTGETNKFKAPFELRSVLLDLEADSYSPDTPQQGDISLIKKIILRLQSLIHTYPNTESAITAKNKIKTLTQPALTLQSENIQLPNKPFLMLAEYKDVSQAKIFIYQVDQCTFVEYQQRGDTRQIMQSLKERGAFRAPEIQLPAFDDHRMHRVEFKMDQLPAGHYIFVIEPENENDELNRSFTYIQVSNLAVIRESNYAQQGMGYYVMDRFSGKPLDRVHVDFYKYHYNESKPSLLFSKETNIDGMVRFGDLVSQNFLCVFSKEGDTLTDVHSNYYNPPYKYKERNIQATFYTDRAIYRPGQIVYFKAVLFQRDDDRVPSILPNKRITITLRDANYNEVSKAVLTSNEFGSIQGSFTLPTGTLTGIMTLSYNDQIGKSIRVEEYKRPKFKVRLDTITQAYKLNDRVKIKGKIDYFAGIPADGSKVTFAVTRKQIWRYPWFYENQFRPSFQTNEMIIANGMVTSATDGTFEFEFNALPDHAIKKSSFPQFNFLITVTATDINGETQSSTESLTLGYRQYNTRLNIDKSASPEAMQSMVLETLNSAGVSIPAKGLLKIELLESPTSYLRPKMYDRPEAANLSRDEYKRLWPYESYPGESDISTYKTNKVLFDGSIISGPNPVPALKSTLFQEGYYRITFQIEGKPQQETASTFYTFVKKKNSSQNFEAGQLISAFTDKEAYKPGDKSLQQYRVRNTSRKMLYSFYVKDKLISREWLDDASGIQKYIDINREYLGGITASVTAYGYSRVENKTLVINVPWTEKQLNIRLKTFRDKLLPGQEETWELIISGPAKDKVAEVLASMYDASLDVFIKDTYQPISFPEYRNASKFADKHNSIVGLYKYFPISLDAETYQPAREFLYSLRLDFDSPYRRRYDVMAMDYQRAGGMPEAAEMAPMAKTTVKSNGDAKTMNETSAEEADIPPNDQLQSNPDIQPPIRKNLEETVFFYPNLYTDKDGNVVIHFKMKEALTAWKFRIFAHTKDLEQGTLEQQVTTSKDLMVFPNLPRYFREGDIIELTSKITNLNGLSGIATVKLELLDAITLQPLSTDLYISPAEQQIALSAGQSSVTTWKIHSPSLPVDAVTVRITAATSSHSDGEDNTLPVLSNRMMVTETMPMMIRSGKQQAFTFQSMLTAMKSKTAAPYRYTLEYTSNPVWYAVQALPYLMEYPSECTDQLVNRYYANTLASYIANSNPRIKAVFEKWKNKDALLSNLQKNEELKSALLVETPWVLEAVSEEQQKKNIGLLFDFNKMASEQRAALKKLEEIQHPSGGFPWFPGCRVSDYVTSSVVENIGHLIQLGVLDDHNNEVNRMLSLAVSYCDGVMKENYERIKREYKDDPSKMGQNHLSYWDIQYLYARSFIKNAPPEFKNSEAYQYYTGQSRKYWQKNNLYLQGMIALNLLSIDKNDPTAQMIMEGMRQTAIHDDLLGVYWKEVSGYYWYSRPLETQAMLIELFSKTSKDDRMVDEMKLWLLSNKRTNQWSTSKATASAIYALLLSGPALNLETQWPVVTIGDKQLDIESTQPEAGTGYFKKSYSGQDITSSLASLNITNQSSNVNWGASYFQYFEQMDKINVFQATPLSIDKKYYIVRNTDRGEQLDPITGPSIKVGDVVRIRTIIRVDRPMEFVHLKDMRPAGTESIQILSGYRYQKGLGYYQSIRDGSTNFFIDYLPQGTWVFEYDIRANLRGDFSTGISTIQCMYAPEFSSHSEGSRITIE